MSTLTVTTYERGFRGLWTGLVVNLLLAVACAPLLLALMLVEDPLAALPFFAVLSCVCGPALLGAFGAFAADDRPAAAFVAAYRQGFRRGLALWAGGAAILGVLAVNVVGALAGEIAFARPLLPMFVVLAVLVVAVLPYALAGASLRVAAVVALRRWYLSALNVLVLAVLVAVLLVKPGIGVLIACAPLLYVVWSNARYALTPQED
ncbi:hypothetical protein [Cellulomonas sp. Leaf334]|uniref:hypothetical protein n=1 Tax=Cellulomonas sp. Leaf334 TaxID=1736339 RepID=UPI0006FCE74F|nr:hypothetical protein [Cellulomonas sp. Leaf334]KQR17096.1 hypothetical protein ASF78_07215 [Cellulomonas sp. Leaf334]